MKDPTSLEDYLGVQIVQSDVISTTCETKCLRARFSYVFLHLRMVSLLGQIFAILPRPHQKPAPTLRLTILRGIPHESPNRDFEAKLKFLWNHRDYKFPHNSQKYLRFQVLRSQLLNIQKKGKESQSSYFDEIEVSQLQTRCTLI